MKLKINEDLDNKGKITENRDEKTTFDFIPIRRKDGYERGKKETDKRGRKKRPDTINGGIASKDGFVFSFYEIQVFVVVCVSAVLTKS